MAEETQCVLVLIGADEWSRKEVLGLADGYRESTRSWRELLLDLKRRGFTRAPELAIGDGALGFWAALREVFGSTREQRCWVHKTGNVLNAMPKPLIPGHEIVGRIAGLSSWRLSDLCRWIEERTGRRLPPQSLSRIRGARGSRDRRPTPPI